MSTTNNPYVGYYDQARDYAPLCEPCAPSHYDGDLHQLDAVDAVEHVGTTCSECGGRLLDDAQITEARVEILETDQELAEADPGRLPDETAVIVAGLEEKITAARAEAAAARTRQAAERQGPEITVDDSYLLSQPGHQADPQRSPERLHADRLRAISEIESRLRYQTGRQARDGGERAEYATWRMREAEHGTAIEGRDRHRQDLSDADLRQRAVVEVDRRRQRELADRQADQERERARRRRAAARDEPDMEMGL